MPPKIIFIIICIFSHYVTKAQSSYIQTDRASNSNTTYTTPKNWLQTEVGFLRSAINYSSTSKLISVEHPNINIKYGLGEKVELRMLSLYESSKDVSGNTIYRNNRLTFLQVGTKFNFLQQKLIIPKVSVMAHLIFNNFKQKNIPIDTLLGFNCKLIFQNKITSGFDLNYSAGLEWQYLFLKNPTINFSLTPTFHFNDEWSIYVELFGNALKKQIPVYNVGTGLSYAINNNLKIDIAADGTINRKKAYKYAPNLFYGLGISYRLPTKN